jgi:transcriptional regulator with XRE-family HTH domain
MPLGKKIRDLRLRRGLTVQQLAGATGLSKGFISQVENHRTSPSLATLHDLARALDTSAAYLVVEEEQEPCVVRSTHRSRVPVGGNTSRVEVLSARPKRNLELVLVELPAGLEAGDHRHYHHGEQCLLCVDGQVRLTCGEHVIDLAEGDSCHYDGRVPHAIENRGSTTARVLIAMTPAAYEPMFRVAKGATAATPGPRTIEPTRLGEAQLVDART